MTAPPITIGHPSFSAFKPYLRPSPPLHTHTTFPSSNDNINAASTNVESFVSPVERAATLNGSGGGSANVVSRRRQRTTFTPTQADTLEKEYLMDQYMPRTRRILIAESLGLNEGQVKTWFQNRRAKEKRNDKNTISSSSNIQRHSLPSISPASSSSSSSSSDDNDNNNQTIAFQQQQQQLSNATTTTTPAAAATTTTTTTPSSSNNFAHEQLAAV